MGRNKIFSEIRNAQGVVVSANPALEGFGYSQLLAYEIAQESAVIERVLTAIDTLENLRVVAERLPTVSIEHLALFETTLTLVRQNVGQYEEIIPALESYAGQHLSSESLVSRIGELINYVRQLISRVIEKIGSFFSVLKDDSTQLWARLGLARDVHKELQGRFPKHPTVYLGQTAIMLSAKDGIPHDAKMLVRNIANLEKQLSSMRTRYVPLVQKTGQQLTAAMNNASFKQGDFEGWLAGLNQAASLMTYSNLAPIFEPLAKMVDSRYAAGSAWMSAPIPGDRSIVLVDGARIHPGDTSSPVEQAVALQNTQLHLVRPNEGHRINLADASMTTMPHNMIGGVLDQVAALLNEMDRAAAANIRVELSKLEQALAQAARQNFSEQTSGIVMVQTGLAYSSAYTKWCSSPYLNLLSHTLSVAGAMISACGKHMAAY